MQNFILACVLIGFVLLPIYLWAKPQSVALMLAKVADTQTMFSGNNVYWLSEKYDGVRAYWDGEKLLFRSGREIHCPKWFTEHLPNQALDGELWIARQTFERVSGITRRRSPDDNDWRLIQFMVFDLPGSYLPFELRQQQLTPLIKQLKLPWVKQVKQLKVENSVQVHTLFKQIVRAGGEGVMLNEANAYYYPGRTDRLLKLKPYHDAEASVLKHIEGKGKYKGKLGALVVKNEAGDVFKIGSGFSDIERDSPPDIGTLITYRHSGFTQSGLPRFATFLRRSE